MPARRLVLLTLLAAAVVGGMIWRLRLTPPPDTAATVQMPSPSLKAPAPVPSTTRVARATPSAADANATADELRARLQRLLVRPNARRNEAVISFVDAEAYRRFLERAQHRGISVTGQLDGLRTVRVRYSDLAALEADLREFSGDYADISANHYLQIPHKPAKEERGRIVEVPFRNSALSFLGVHGDNTAWGRGVRVAVLDSGVALDPTFSPGRVQYLDVGLGTLPGNGAEDGHGTSVASLLAGTAPDAPGAAPGSTILSIRVTDATGRSDIFTVAQAILAAADAGAPVINLSLGGYATTSALTSAIDYALAHGSVIVAAAGNDQAAQLTWPAADPRVISVGAVDARGQQVTFSNSGQQLKVSAPGYGVQTAWSEGSRVYVDGTSASAPLVSAAIAAVMSQTPGMKADDAWATVQRTTNDAGAPGADSNYGAGVLNLDWAMNASNSQRVDPAISSHYYDAARSEMNFVVQNRSARAVANLGVDLDVNGSTRTYRVPELAAGGSYVLKVPVSRAAVDSTAGVTFTTQLVTPFGLEDSNPANNRVSSRLSSAGEADGLAP